MHIGKLDRRITFIKPIYENGASNGDTIIGWEQLDTDHSVWAQKIERNGQTLVDQDRIKLVQVTSWIVRYRTDLNIRMRLVFNTKVYQVVNVVEADKDRGRYTQIEASLIDNEYYT